VRTDGVLWEKIEFFQEDCQISGLELRLHLYYRVLRSDREYILNNVLKIMSEAHQTLGIMHIRTLSGHYLYLTEEEQEIYARSFQEYCESAWGAISALRLANAFLDIYETAPTKELIERMDEMGRRLNLSETCIYSNSKLLMAFIESEYKILHHERKKTPNGFIHCIWEIESMRQVPQIQRACFYPVTVVESVIDNEKKVFVIGYKNKNTIQSCWVSVGRTLPKRVELQIASSLGSFELDYLCSNRCRFKQLLNILGFPIKCIYK
jgi:hypothetical protein